MLLMFANFYTIGMNEVSTCEFTVQEGQYVKKGDELGMFHYGGSTHCLIFGPQVNIEFCNEDMPNGGIENVLSKLATVGASR